MAQSPQLISFTLYSASTGTPLPGQTPTFLTYCDETGAAILPQPTIVEIGGGGYYFIPTFHPGHGTFYVVDGGSGTASRYVSNLVRPEDYYPDMILDLEDEIVGKWQVFTSGPDANRLVLYRQDGVTVLKKFDLKDSTGAPTSTLPFTRIPV